MKSLKRSGKGGEEIMNIITDECLACASLKECGTEVMKGSIVCQMKRLNNKQTKEDMLLKMFGLAELANRKRR